MIEREPLYAFLIDRTNRTVVGKLCVNFAPTSTPDESDLLEAQEGETLSADINSLSPVGYDHFLETLYPQLVETYEDTSVEPRDRDIVIRIQTHEKQSTEKVVEDTAADVEQVCEGTEKSEPKKKKRRKRKRKKRRGK